VIYRASAGKAGLRGGCLIQRSTVKFINPAPSTRKKRREPNNGWEQETGTAIGRTSSSAAQRFP